MERSLCLLIGKEANIDKSNYLVLTKPTDNFKALDCFTMKRFQNSDEIREYFKDEIDSFLLKNQHLLKGNRRGAIVILETHYNAIPVKRRVLYMEVVQIVNEILNDYAFLRYLVNIDEESSNLRLFSGYLRDVILIRNHQDYNAKERRVILNTWKEDTLKTGKTCTDKLRKILKLYEQYLKDNNLETPKREVTIKQKVIAKTLIDKELKK